MSDQSRERGGQFCGLLPKLIFLSLDGNMHYGYSLEFSDQDSSNEYQLLMVLWRNKEII